MTLIPELVAKESNAQWARVELYRWQHGHLPGAPGTVEQPLNVAAGIRAMADAIERGDPLNFPTPFNVVSVLRYVADNFSGRRDYD